MVRVAPCCWLTVYYFKRMIWPNLCWKYHKFWLDSMCRFSHRRSPSPLGGHAVVSSVAVCCIQPSYGTRPTVHCQWGWLSSFSFFCPWWPWPLTLTFELWRDLCTMYLTAEFDHPTFSSLEVIVRTNKHWQTKTNRRYWKHPPHFATLRWWVIKQPTCMNYKPHLVIIIFFVIFRLVTFVKKHHCSKFVLPALWIMLFICT